MHHSSRSSRIVLAASLAALCLAAAVLPAGANVSVVPYRSDGWKYQIVTGSPPLGWQFPDFDDSGFSTGCAAFGTQGDCPLNACTAWPLSTKIILRRSFDVPDSLDRLFIGLAYDNAITVYLNGIQLGTRSTTSEDCSEYNRALFTASPPVVGHTNNVIAILGEDYGVHSILDVALEAALTSPPPPPPPAVPGTISICAVSTDRADGVYMTWNDVLNEDGYHVYRDGALVATLGIAEISYLDTPPPGSYTYCVQAFNTLGTSNQCCQTGVRLALAPPSPCSASDSSGKEVRVSWANVADEDGYRVYRDGTLIYTAQANETYCSDVPPAGTYSYCVEAFTAIAVSAQCCDTGRRLPVVSPMPCTASDSDRAGILVTWANVEDEQGYRVLRNNVLVHTTAADETTWTDTPVPGTYQYCVKAYSAGGESYPACDYGARPVLPTPGSCYASANSSAQVLVSWANIEGALGYSVFRAGSVVHTAGPGETSFADIPPPGTYQYCVQAFDAYGTSGSCCHSGTRLVPAGPSPCSASDDNPDHVLVSWANVAGESGYRVYRDEALVQETGPDVTTWTDVPPPGSYTYCVEVVIEGGAPRCCETGRRTAFAAAPVVTAGDGDEAGVRVEWTALPGAEGYRVSRDQALVYTAGPGETSYWDVPLFGRYSYCVEAFSAAGSSAPGCDDGARVYAGPGITCAASDTVAGGVALTWSDAGAETGYRIYRNGSLIATTAADVSSYFDVSLPGTYDYCIEPFDDRGGWTRCCDAGGYQGAPVSGPGLVRLSWNACPAYVQNQNFVGPGIYKLVLSATNLGETYEGHDTRIDIWPALNDAWRFDDTGCQTGSQWSTSAAAFNKSCPAIEGARPLGITAFWFDTGTGHAEIRLANTFDAVTAIPSTRYTLYVVSFDHSYTVWGPSEPGVSCGGAEVGYFFTDITTVLLRSDGVLVDLGHSGNENAVTWQGGAPVNARRLTWGRLKALYR